MTSWEVVLWGNTHSLGSSTGKIPAIVYKTWNLFKQSFGFVSSLLLTFCELPPFNHKSQTHHSVNRHKWEHWVWPWTYAHFYLGVKLSWFVQRNKAIFSASGVVSLCRQVRQHILWPYISFLNFIFHITSMALTVDAHSFYSLSLLPVLCGCQLYIMVLSFESHLFNRRVISNAIGTKRARSEI